MNINILSIIIAALFLTDVSVCLCSLGKGHKKTFAVTKILLMPLLLATYLALLPSEAIRSRKQFLLVAALLFHSFGDAMLIKETKESHKMFWAGMISFLIGHFCYAGWFLSSGFAKSGTILTVAIIALAGAEIYLYFDLGKGNRQYLKYLMGYSVLLGALGVVVATTVISSPGHITLISLAGVALFAFSDYNIARQETDRDLFGLPVIMITYIAAQVMIMTGIYLSQLL